MVIIDAFVITNRKIIKGEGSLIKKSFFFGTKKKLPKVNLYHDLFQSGRNCIVDCQVLREIVEANPSTSTRILYYASKFAQNFWITRKILEFLFQTTS